MRSILVVAAMLAAQPAFAQVQFVSEPSKPRPAPAKAEPMPMPAIPPWAVFSNPVPAVCGPNGCQPPVVQQLPVYRPVQYPVQRPVQRGPLMRLIRGR